ncbi:MAG: nucleotidyl transferase AbiEii/AbiGii toxin family protein [Candidatus Dormibacteria bacterium]
MRYATASAFRQALDDRLKAEASDTGHALSRLRKRVAFELFLRRLIATAPDHWVLKGALALDFRLKVARSTKDIDLGRSDDEQAAIEDITTAQQEPMDDFFNFVATRTSAFADQDDVAAIRFHVRAELAGRIFEQFTVDIGFSDQSGWVPDQVQTSDLLSFAGVVPASIPTIPIPQHLAEKVHAYTRLYGENDEPSSRPKDLVDILLIAGSEEIKATEFRAALEQTFTMRKRQPLPAALPAPPVGWAAPYRRLAVEVGVEPELPAAHVAAAGFVDPILSRISSASWHPEACRWMRIRPGTDKTARQLTEPE